MNENQFDKRISIDLSQDEAIVLCFYLTRQLWEEEEKNLRQKLCSPGRATQLACAVARVRHR
jgi:hypothetical protein